MPVDMCCRPARETAWNAEKKPAAHSGKEIRRGAGASK